MGRDRGLSALRGRQLEGTPDRRPDDLRRLTRVQGLLRGPLPQLADDELAGPGTRVRRAEGGLHPGPELRVPHATILRPWSGADRGDLEPALTAPTLPPLDLLDPPPGPVRRRTERLLAPVGEEARGGDVAVDRPVLAVPLLHRREQHAA